MPYTYTLTSVIPATPQEVYDAWLDSAAHSAMTGGEANMSDEIGAEISAWDGYISGSNRELVPGKRIVQSWRTNKFADEHDDSIVTIMLEEVEGGTLLTLVHSNVPDEHRSYEQGGWESHYFEPMKAYFAGLEDDDEEEEPEADEDSEEEESEEEDEADEEDEEVVMVVETPPPGASKRRTKAKTGGKRAAAKRPKAKAKAKPKAKKAAPRKKKRAVAAKAKRKSARPAARKSKRASPKKKKAGRRNKARR